MKEELETQIKREVNNNVQRVKTSIMRKITMQIRQLFNSLLKGI